MTIPHRAGTTRDNGNSVATDDFLRAEQAAQFILERTSLRPRIGAGAGSGLGAVADGLADAVRIPYEDIPHFPTQHGRGSCGHAGPRDARQHSLGRDAGSRASLRRLFAAAGCSSRACLRTHGSARHGADKCRRRNQSRIWPRRAGGAARPHQSARQNPLHWPERRAPWRCVIPT